MVHQFFSTPICSCGASSSGAQAHRYRADWLRMSRVLQQWCSAGICRDNLGIGIGAVIGGIYISNFDISFAPWLSRSEEHTSELQSRFDLVCRLLLEKKKR